MFCPENKALIFLKREKYKSKEIDLKIVRYKD
jgi:hypothetical protein